MSDHGSARSYGQAHLAAPYPRATQKRLPNASSSNMSDVWGDAESRKSDAHTELLELASAEIEGRKNSVATTMAVVDTQSSVSDDTQNGKIGTKVLAGRLDLIQTKVGEKSNGGTAQIQMTQLQQNNTVSAADQLVKSLQDALAALNLSQLKHEAAIQHNEAQLTSMMKNSQELMAKNVELEQLPRNQLQALAVQEERQRTLSQQAEVMQQQQWIHNQQLGAQSQTRQQIQQ